MADVVALAQRGDLIAARKLGESLLAARPKDPGLLHLVGVVTCQAGDAARGTPLLRRAFALTPRDMALRVNFARALLDVGAYREAASVADVPDAPPELVRLRGDILKLAGDPAQAMAAYRAAVAAQPGDHAAWNNLGNAALDAGDGDAAVMAFERALALSPGSALIQRNLGKALGAAGRYAQSVERLEQAAAADPSDALTLLELGRALNRVGAHGDALARLGDAARIDRTSAEIFVAIGLTFAELGEFDRAEQGYRFALQAEPGDAQAYLNLGILLEQANRLDDLAALLAEATARLPEGDVLAFLKAVAARRRGDERGALALAQQVQGDAVDTVILNQLIGQLADRLGNTDTAFAAFRRMNEAMAREPIAARFDGTEHRRYVESLAQLTTPEWVASWRPVTVAATPPAPVFLVGFPRSGTTLLDTVLMGHPATHVLEEEPLMARVRQGFDDMAQIADLDEAAVNELRARYFRALAEVAPANPGKLVIDKLPLNLLRGPLIHRIFPDARFIFALRHPCDAVLSCFMQNFKVNQAMASLLDLTNAARFYDAAMGYWQQSRAVMPLDVHELRYEGLVADLAGELRPLIDFLGLEWDDRLLDHQRTASDRGIIRTPSYNQVTEKIYARAKGRWTRYRAHMAPVLPILAPWAERFGYGPLDANGPLDGASGAVE
ncbi:hypothetical protein BFL28_02105 [Sphingomonas turrisvirgatae]|uniref:Sulfotransferase n=2 Tax=Sphingomonas turrisvirgatae TaxID=1888892 RepID=A0A1E3LVJ0_9SPHN|nr:hypothetical protein BFL28_02105 [Sphingomonas turrisvirgatae]